MDAAYQTYVEVWIERYIDEPTLFGWGLANEPRCAGPTNVTSGTCTTTTITNWVKTMSVYIKCLDGNHLVGLGDEGWFNCTNSTDAVRRASILMPTWPSRRSTLVLSISTRYATPLCSSTDSPRSQSQHLQYSWDEETPSAMSWGQTWIENQGCTKRRKSLGCWCARTRSRRTRPGTGPSSRAGSRVCSSGKWARAGRRPTMGLWCVVCA
ncbi:Glycoside hydrolase superfamily [Tylopilus felleus]